MHGTHLQLALAPLHVQRDVLQCESKYLQPLVRDDSDRKLLDERRHAREVGAHLLAQRFDAFLEVADLRRATRFCRLRLDRRRRRASALAGRRPR